MLIAKVKDNIVKKNIKVRKICSLQFVKTKKSSSSQVFSFLQRKKSYANNIKKNFKIRL